MSVSLFLMCLSAGVAADPAAGNVLPLFAEEAWYKEAKAAEAVFDGTLERTPTSGGIGRPGRHNAFRLDFKESKQPSRELYLPGKAHLLATHVGQRIRVVGKAVDTEADGKTYAEIWPARVELPGAAVVFPAAREGIYARASWQPSGAAGFGTRFYVIRAGTDLARHMRLSGGGAADAAAAQMAFLLRVPGIDWKKYMLVSVSAGLRGKDAEQLTITRVATQDGVLTVYYRLVPSAGGTAGFGFPAETVLVDRCDGEVRIRPEEPARTDGPARP